MSLSEDRDAVRASPESVQGPWADLTLESNAGCNGNLGLNMSFSMVQNHIYRESRRTRSLSCATADSRHPDPLPQQTGFIYGKNTAL